MCRSEPRRPERTSWRPRWALYPRHPWSWRHRHHRHPGPSSSGAPPFRRPMRDPFRRPAGQGLLPRHIGVGLPTIADKSAATAGRGYAQARRSPPSLPATAGLRHQVTASKQTGSIGFQFFNYTLTHDMKKIILSAAAVLLACAGALGSEAQAADFRVGYFNFSGSWYKSGEGGAYIQVGSPPPGAYIMQPPAGFVPPPPPRPVVVTPPPPPRPAVTPPPPRPHHAKPAPRPHPEAPHPGPGHKHHRR